MSYAQGGYHFPKPGKALMWFMVAIACLWVMFAMAINWGGAGTGLFKLLAGDSQAVMRGQVWRLLTAALLHQPGSPMHPLIVLMLLYFFGTPLEERWGAKKLFRFFAATTAFSFLVQTIVNVLLPGVAPTSMWYGGMGMAEAAAVAWALGARGQTVRLFFVIPVSPMLMVGLFGAWSVLALIARSPQPEGLITPLAALLGGYLFSDSSPLRRYFLKAKLHRIQAEVDGMRKRRHRERANLRVVGDDDEKPPTLN